MTLMENELEVIANAKKDPSAFGLLYDEYYKPVFGFMYNRTSHAEVAKDLTSETFFQALKNFHKYKPRKGVSFKSWLFAIAVAQVGNYYRHRSKYFEVTTEEAPEILDREEYRPDIAYQLGEDAVELQNQIEILRSLMNELTEIQKTIVTLRFFSHMSIPEISGVINTKQGTVKSHLHRALKRLQTLMNEKVNQQNDSVKTKTTYETAVATQR